MSCSFPRAPRRGAISRKQPSARISFYRQPGAPRPLCERPKMFWRKKNKGRKWRRTDGACVSAEKGGSRFQSLVFSKLLFLLFFQTSRSRQPWQGWPARSARSVGERWPPERSRRRPRQPRRAEMANEEICATKQTGSFRGSFDSGLMSEGVAGGPAAPPDPSAAGCVRPGGGGDGGIPAPGSTRLPGRDAGIKCAQVPLPSSAPPLLLAADASGQQLAGGSWRCLGWAALVRSVRTRTT